jgi:hypothetical protein
MLRGEFCAGAFDGRLEPNREGRSLIPRGEFCAGAFDGPFEPKPCDGRSCMARGEFCAGAFDGRFEPKPCDGRSCMARGEFCAGAFDGRFEPKPCDGRSFMARGEFCAGAFVGRFPTEAFALAGPLTCGFPNRPALIAPLFIVFTGICEAAEAGAVRAITARFCTEAEGRATLEWKLALPSELCCVGRIPTELVTLAFLKDAWVRCCAPRLMRSPLTNALREAVVTARRLCAFTKFTLRTFVFRMFTLRIKVL